MARGTLLVSTLRALMTARRALPIAAVAVALLAAEAVSRASALAVMIDLALCLAFVVAAPAAWRWFASGRRRRSGAVTVLGVMAYLGLCAALVLALGLGLPMILLDGWTYVTEPPSLGVVFMLFAVGGWGLGRDIELEAGLAAETRRAELMALEAERAQLLALRAHLDPHFLFNTLNAIAEWCREDPETAEAATLELATMLRTILAGVRAPLWSLRRELELIEHLATLYQVRDPDRFRVNLELADPLPELELPPMVLLPLVENAIKHGPAAGHQGPVRLSVAPEDDGGARVTISNPGAFRRRTGGVGLELIERRLALAYEGAATLKVEADPEDPSSTLTTLLLPRQIASPEEVSPP